MYVVTKFDTSFSSLVMVAESGGFTLHADKASSFPFNTAADYAAALTRDTGTTHHVYGKPPQGFSGTDPI